MFDLVFHTRPNGSCPYDEYVRVVLQSSAKKKAAKISATVERLRQFGSADLVKIQRAEKMNDVWQLRVDPHRVFYFWHADARHYVMLNGFRKRTRKTPPEELERAEDLRSEHLEAGAQK